MTPSEQSDSPAAQVSLQVYSPVRASANDATVLVRCIDGPVRIGAIFQRLRRSGHVIQLVVTKINRTEQLTVDALWPGEGARVELAGTGGNSLQELDMMEGTNPDEQ